MALVEMDVFGGGGMKIWQSIQGSPSSLTEYDSSTHLINIGFKPKIIVMADPKYNSSIQVFCYYNEDYNPSVYLQTSNQGSSASIQPDRTIESGKQIEEITDNGFKIGFASNMSANSTIIAIG